MAAFEHLEVASADSSAMAGTKLARKHLAFDHLFGGLSQLRGAAWRASSVAYYPWAGGSGSRRDSHAGT